MPSTPDPSNRLSHAFIVSLLTACLLYTGRPAAAVEAPNNGDIPYYLTLQLGGEDAHAVPGLLRTTENVLLDLLLDNWASGSIFNAWNVSTCINGAPVPAPSNTVAEQGLLPTLDASPAPSPDILSAWVAIVEPQVNQGRRRLHDNSSAGDSQDDDNQQAIAPSTSRTCLAQADIVFQLMSAAPVTESQLNQTALIFSNGAFLSKLSNTNSRIEQAQLPNLSQTWSGVQTDSSGQGSLSSEPFTLGPNPAEINTSLVTFTLNLVGQDAQVTNDGVLGSLYTMVTNASYYSNSSFWLTGQNTAIVDVKQGPPVMVNPQGRRRLLSIAPYTVVLRRQRMLTQSTAGDGEDAQPTPNPSIDVTLKVQDVPSSEVSTVKTAANQLVEGDYLVDGFQAANISIVAVNLTSFASQPTGALPKPPVANPPNPLPISPRSSRHTVLVVVLAITLPICFALAILIGASIVWWWGRRAQRRRERAYHRANSMYSGSKGRHPDSEESSESLGIFTLQSTKSGLSHLSPQAQLLDMPWNDWKIEPSELTILTKPDGNKWLLGTGASGTVYKALRNGVQVVAVKLFREDVTRGAITSFNSWSHAAQFKREISILKSCHDRNIVQFIGACLAEGQTSLVTEFLENGDLYRAINSPQGCRYHWYRMYASDGRPLPNSGMAKRVALDVARGLHFLHTRKIVHFDLKSANILLARDFTAKIADVGLAKVLHDDVLSCRREIGTFAWAAPEILLGHGTTEAADIYSFGVLLHELSAQESPRGRQLRKLQVPEEVPAEINNLITRCLSITADDRPTARELVAMLSSISVQPTNANQQNFQAPQPIVNPIHAEAFQISGGNNRT